MVVHIPLMNLLTIPLLKMEYCYGHQSTIIGVLPENVFE